MSALVLLGLAGAAFADGQAVLNDARDNNRIDACYSRAEFRDALHQARADQRLYGTTVDTIQEGYISNVTVPGRACGTGRTVPSHAVAVSSSGASTVWGAAALVVIAGAAVAGAVARRGGPGGRG